MRIGLIGCGERAIEHIGGYRRCPGVEIVLADADPECARAFGEREGLGWVRSAAEIFADPTIDAVDLCVPAAARAPLIRGTLAADKDFLCDQPLCDTVAEARELRDLATRNGRVGMTGCGYRHAPAFQKARAILGDAYGTGASPVIGKLSVATMRIGARGAAAELRPCRSGDAEVSDAALNEMLLHLLDVAVWYFGPIERVELMVGEALRPRRKPGHAPESGDARDFVVVRCATRTGLPIVMQADLLSPCFSQMIEVQGENGAIMLSNQTGVPQFVFAATAANGYRAGRTALSGGPVDLFAAQTAAFVAAARDRKPDQRDALADCVHVVEALEMLRGGPRG